MLLAIRCEVAEVAPDVAAARLRQPRPGCSDADERTAARMATHAQPWPEAVVVRTDQTPDDSVEQALVAAGSFDHWLLTGQRASISTAIT